MFRSLARLFLIKQIIDMLRSRRQSRRGGYFGRRTGLLSRF
jgi:hypothetical protein